MKARTNSKACAAGKANAAVRLSVIVPFGPHETEGALLLRQLQQLPRGDEIILAGTREHRLPYQPRAENTGAPICTVSSLAGRARQMNAGAHAARGRWLWFLHADSCLTSHTLIALDSFLATDAPALGYFDLRYRHSGPALACLNAWGANLRARCLGMPFGDQGLVLPTRWFKQLGGFDETVACGEDHRLVWRARAADLPLKRMPAPIETSAREYADHGWMRTTLRHLRLTVRQAWPEWQAFRTGHRASRGTTVTKRGFPP